jgi:hypothetical protein
MSDLNYFSRCEEVVMSRLTKQSTVSSRYSVNVPRFVAKKDIGLGDVIKRTASAAGFQSCGECERRAASLNQWLVISVRRAK